MRKFGLKRGPRKSFLKIMAYNLITNKRIETTEARAKELKPRVEKLVTLAKKQTLASYRLLLARLPKEAANKLYYELAVKYKDRNGGYLRILKTATGRKRDASLKTIIEFV